MRAALSWAAETGDQTLGLEARRRTRELLGDRGPEEGLEWAITLLAGADQAGAVDPGLVARALRVQGGMQSVTGQVDASDASWEQALTIVRRLGDDRAVATLLHRLSTTAMRRGITPRSRTRRGEPRGPSSRRYFPKGEAQALTSLAWVAQQEDDLVGALELLREARAKAAEGRFRWWEAGTLTNIGAVSLQLGKLDDARSSTLDALSISSAMHDRRGVVYELRLLAELAAARGNDSLASTLSGAVEAEAGRAPVGRWVHSWAREPVVPSPLDEQALEQGRRLSLGDAVALALAG